MNWGRKVWHESRIVQDNAKYKGAYSSINFSSLEFPTGGPYGVKVRNMAEVNRTTLKLYRLVCRFVPTILNRHNLNDLNDYHMSKRIAAMWFRRGKNMKNFDELSKTYKMTADTLYDAVYGNIEFGMFIKYLQQFPETKDSGKKAASKVRGIDLHTFNKFEGKTRFFEKFVKGTRSLY